MKIPSMARVLISALGAGALSACGGSGGDSQQHNIACAQLPANFLSSDASVKLASATEVAATDASPAFCDVRGTIKGNIKFAVYLPKQWNGRFQMVGNGGKAGVISFAAMAAAVQEGYAAASTDTGHDSSIQDQGGSRFGLDTKFGDELEIDFGYRAVHLTAQAAKQLTNAHYDKNIEFSYWNGCSTGGRQGLMEAQRFPDDFDGYVIGAPVNDYTRQQIVAPALLSHLYKNGISGGSVLSPAKRDMVGNIIYNGNGGNYPGCDALDGLKDGQIREPLKCNFDPAVHVPACGATPGPNCLTAGELSALQGVYAGRPDANVHPMPVGAESMTGDWSEWLITNSGAPPLAHFVMGDAFQYLMFDPDRPTFNYLTDFDWSTDPAKMAKARQIFNATDPDLRAFAAKGKKIIMYHGWADAGVNPLGTIEYKNRVEAAIGSGVSADSFMKLYMVPGMGHCGDGPGHTSVKWMDSLTKWVEQGQAPTSVTGTKPGTTSTRIHCPHPTVAVYNGTGDVESASSFTCRAPS